MEVNIPFLGIPIKGINNPILVLKAVITLNEEKVIKTDIFNKFAKEFNEATGFDCAKGYEYWNYSFPFSSYYVYITDKISTEAIDRCNIPISDDERYEIIQLIDEALFPENSVIKALRISRRLGKQILFRNGEEPVEVNIKSLKVKVLYSFPLGNNPNYIDNSLIHLLGVIPIEFVETNVINLIQFENGLWSAIYSLSFPQVKNWKWIWDVNWVTLIEFSNLEEV